MKLLAVYTTVTSQDDARRLATAVVERRLAACVQMSAIESVYAWNGAVQREPEVRLVFKTTEDRYGALEAAILELHGYTLPAIHAVAVERAHGPYADWVAQQVEGG